MKLNDETVLDGLHLDPADLSSGRPFIKEAATDAAEENPASPTRSVMEARGILYRAEKRRTIVDDEESRAAEPTSSEALKQKVAESTRRLPVVWVPVVVMSRDGFEVLQKFEGTVLSVEDDAVVARLLDRTHPGPEEEAEIPLAEIMPGDREMVKPGAVFYWVIGYRREAHGQLSRSSMIRFQRIPSWSPVDVEQAKMNAETFLSFVDLECANKPA